MCVFSDTLKYLYLFILAASGMDILTQTKHFANAWTVSGIFLFCLCELVFQVLLYHLCFFFGEELIVIFSWPVFLFKSLSSD